MSIANNYESIKLLEELLISLKNVKTKNPKWFEKLCLIYVDEDLHSHFKHCRDNYEEIDDLIALEILINDFDNVVKNIFFTDNFDVNELLILILKPYGYEFDHLDLYIPAFAFINAIKSYENIIYKSNAIIVSSNTALIPVDISGEYETLLSFNDVFSNNQYDSSNNTFEEGILEYNYEINDSVYTLSIVQGFSLYSLEILDTNKYNFDEIDTFIKIDASNTYSDKDIELLLNLSDSYLFSLSKDKKLIAERTYKQDNSFDYSYYENTKLNLRLDETFNLFFSKGIPKLANLYNSALNSKDNEFSIIQYNKILEAIAETVKVVTLYNELSVYFSGSTVNIASEKTISALQKIIKSNNNDFSNQQKQLKQTLMAIWKNSNIQISMIPAFIKKSVKNPIDSTELINQISKSIKDTRNGIAHGKFTYEESPLQCPSSEYPEYLNLLNHLTKQAIEWYYNTDQNLRVTD